MRVLFDHSVYFSSGTCMVSYQSAFSSESSLLALVFHRRGLSSLYVCTHSFYWRAAVPSDCVCTNTFCWRAALLNDVCTNSFCWRAAVLSDCVFTNSYRWRAAVLNDVCTNQFCWRAAVLNNYVCTNAFCWRAAVLGDRQPLHQDGSHHRNHQRQRLGQRIPGQQLAGLQRNWSVLLVKTDPF